MSFWRRKSDDEREHEADAVARWESMQSMLGPGEDTGAGPTGDPPPWQQQTWAPPFQPDQQHDRRPDRPAGHADDWDAVISSTTVRKDPETQDPETQDPPAQPPAPPMVPPPPAEPVWSGPQSSGRHGRDAEASPSFVPGPDGWSSARVTLPPSQPLPQRPPAVEAPAPESPPEPVADATPESPEPPTEGDEINEEDVVEDSSEAADEHAERGTTELPPPPQPAVPVPPQVPPQVPPPVQSWRSAPVADAGQQPWPPPPPQQFPWPPPPPPGPPQAQWPPQPPVQWQQQYAPPEQQWPPQQPPQQPQQPDRAPQPPETPPFVWTNAFSSGGPPPVEGPPPARAPEPPLAQQWGPPAPPAPTRAPSADALSAASLVRQRRNTPQAGWRKAVYQLSAHSVNPGESRQELQRRGMVGQATIPVHGCYRIAVISLKGGVGKTTTTVCLGATLASLRGDRVIAVDANPDRGTLSGKIPLQTTATVRNLLNEVDRIERYSDVRRFTSQSADRLEVLASESDPSVSQAFSEEDYCKVAGVLERFYNVVLTDCGTGLLHSAMAGVLSLANQLVVVSSGSVDGARSASATIDWLEAHGYSALVAGSVAVINSVRPKSGGVNIDALEQHFASRCRSVTRIPYDPHLELGAEVDLAELAAPTRAALLELAAHVADGFSGLPRPAGPSY